MSNLKKLCFCKNLSISWSIHFSKHFLPPRPRPPKATPALFPICHPGQTNFIMWAGSKFHYFIALTTARVHNYTCFVDVNKVSNLCWQILEYNSLQNDEISGFAIKPCGWWIGNRKSSWSGLKEFMYSTCASHSCCNHCKHKQIFSLHIKCQLNLILSS